MADATCSIEGCDGKTVARGWCGTHWKRWKRTGDPGAATPPRTRPESPAVCSVEDCTSVAKARGMCEKHYVRTKRHGDPHVTLTMRGIAECVIEGCGGGVQRKGMCQVHYTRWRRHGDPNFSMFDTSFRTERFWATVDREGAVPAYDPSLGPCWIWTGKLNEAGYGMHTFSVDGAVHRMAYRIAYIITVGPVPAGLSLDHLCRVRSCVNPSHLEPVTVAENNRRSVEARRRERWESQQLGA